MNDMMNDDEWWCDMMMINDMMNDQYEWMNNKWMMI